MSSEEEQAAQDSDSTITFPGGKRHILRSPIYSDSDGEGSDYVPEDAGDCTTDDSAAASPISPEPAEEGRPTSAPHLSDDDACEEREASRRARNAKRRARYRLSNQLKSKKRLSTHPEAVRSRKRYRRIHTTTDAVNLPESRLFDADQSSHCLFSSRSINNAIEDMDKFGIVIQRACLQIKGLLLIRQVIRARGEEFKEKNKREREGTSTTARESVSCPFPVCKVEAQNLIRHFHTVHGATFETAKALKETMNELNNPKCKEIHELLKLASSLKDLANDEDRDSEVYHQVQDILRRVHLYSSFGGVFDTRSDVNLIKRLQSVVRGKHIPLKALTPQCFEALMTAPSTSSERSTETCVIEEPITRQVANCIRCNRYVPANKVRFHLQQKHHLKDKELMDVQGVIINAVETKTLIRAPKRGESLHNLICPEDPNLDVPNNDESQTEDTSRGHFHQLRVSLANDNFMKETYPKLQSLREELQSLVRGSSEKRSEQYVSMILLNHAIVTKEDIGIMDSYQNIYEIMQTGKDLLLMKVRVPTAKKIFTSFKLLNKLLTKKNHTLPDSFPRFDSNVMKQAIDSIVKDCMKDSQWCLALPSASIRKEENFLPIASLNAFNESRYLKELFQGALNFGNNQPKGKKPMPSPCLLNTQQNSIELRNGLITRLCTMMARRAQEFSSLTLGEAMNPVTINDDCVIIRCAKHKTWRQRPCFIYFTPQLFQTMIIYLRYYRHRIYDCHDTNSPAFPSSITTVQGRVLSVSSIGTITHKTFLKAGVNIKGLRACPRRIRETTVTTCEGSALAEKEMENLAFCMNHSRQTAKTHYTVGAVAARLTASVKIIEKVSSGRAKPPSSNQCSAVAMKNWISGMLGKTVAGQPADDTVIFASGGSSASESTDEEDPVPILTEMGPPATPIGTKFTECDEVPHSSNSPEASLLSADESSVSISLTPQRKEASPSTASASGDESSLSLSLPPPRKTASPSTTVVSEDESSISLSLPPPTKTASPSNASASGDSSTSSLPPPRITVSTSTSISDSSEATEASEASRIKLPGSVVTQIKKSVMRNMKKKIRRKMSHTGKLTEKHTRELLSQQELALAGGSQAAAKLLTKLLKQGKIY